MRRREGRGIHWTTEIAVVRNWSCLCILAFLIFVTSPPVQAQASEQLWVGADGGYLPFTTDAEILLFLQTAEVVSRERVGSGVNNPWKVLLEREGVRAHAIFRDVSIEKDEVRLKDGLRFDFRDDAIFEVAAYRLARLLHLNNVPPVVIRELFGDTGTLQLWLEDALTEANRLKQKLRPLDMNRVQRWQIQTHIMRAFDVLIYNEDRNHGNVLYDANWNLWMIDHTRAFRRYRRLLNPATVWRVEKSFLESLKSLDSEEVKEALKNCLRPSEIRGLLARAKLLLRHAEKLIAEKGSDLVLVELPPLKDPQMRPLAAALQASGQ